VLFYILIYNLWYYLLQRYTNTPTTESSAETPGWKVVDLRRGQLLWHKDTSNTLDFGMVLQFHTVQEYGTQAWLVASQSSP